MKLCAMTIWYVPFAKDIEKNKQDIIKNLQTYASYFETVYIVDNSELNNFNIIKNIKNVIYISNMKNIGVASALNIGCQRALDDDFDWILTMDQDSSWKEDQIRTYLKLACNKIVQDKEIRSIAAMPQTAIIHSTLGRLARRLHIYKDSIQSIDDMYVDRCITSGNLISLNTWKEIGGFNDCLFIDEVDYDFCYRLRERGYKIYQFVSCKFIHSLGYPKNHFLPASDNHSIFRFYYMIRNRYFIIHNYPVYSKEFKYKKSIRHLFITYCLLNINCFFNLKIYLKAKKDVKML